MDPDTHIRKKFHVKHRDTPPYTGWWNSTRDTFDETLAELGMNRGAEIGVCKGQHARTMLRLNKKLELALIDPWCAYNRLSQQKANLRFESCKKRLAPYEDRITYFQMTSMEAVDQFNDKSLDFVYIDGLHEFDPVMMDLIRWVPKVRMGGIVGGHDYYIFYQSGIVSAVNAYTQAHCIHDWYVTRDKEATWFWVRKASHV